MRVRAGTLLLRKLTYALDEGLGHIEIYEEFTDDLRASYRDQLVAWRTAIREWEQGEMGASSPYDLEGEGTLNE